MATAKPVIGLVEKLMQNWLAKMIKRKFFIMYLLILKEEHYGLKF